MPRFLSALVSFWSSEPQPDDSGDSIHDSKLPPELWRIVIGFVMNEIRHPYRYCTPATFPQYQARFSLADQLERDATLDDWRHIRSVCRTWKGLAGSQPHVNIKRVPLDITKTDIWNRASSIVVHKEAGEHLELRSFLLSPEMNSLTTIIFGEGYHRHSLDTLLKNPSSFCNVRCLSLPNVKGDGSFWQKLQDGYPQLVSLTIRQYAGGDTGRYTFENLEILDISIWKSFRLSCPSLKHFAFRYGCTPPIAEFLMEHGHQLESLFLDDYALIGAEVCLKGLWMTGNDEQTMRKDIWALFPNIQTLGIAPETLGFTLPHEHPLRNLRLLSYSRTLNTGRVLEALESLPGVARVHIQSNDLESGTMDDLRAQCLERNVEVVAVMNGKVTEYPTVPSFVGWIAVALTCPCWALLLFCPPFTSRRRRRR